MGTVTVRKADDDTFEIEWEDGDTATASSAEEAAGVIGVTQQEFNGAIEDLDENEDTVEFEVPDDESEEVEDEEEDKNG